MLKITTRRVMHGLCAGLLILAAAVLLLNFQVQRMQQQIAQLQSRAAPRIAIRAHALAVSATGEPSIIECSLLPCPSDQLETWLDPNGAPIMSIPLAGGPKVYGDNFSVYRPNSVYDPSVILSYATPDSYADQFALPDSCVPPAKWIDPADTWTCQSGIWKRIGG